MALRKGKGFKMKGKSVKIIVLLVVAVLVAGVVYLKLLAESGRCGDQRFHCQRPTWLLTATVNSAGNIQTHQSVDSSFGQSGTVKTINVG